MTARPPRVMDPYSAEFWRFTNEQKLCVQACLSCRRLRWPPSPICDDCLSFDYAWHEMSGRGQTLSWVTFHRGYFAEYPPPYTCMLVQLEEGPLFPTLATPGWTPASGEQVTVRWLPAEDVHGEYWLPAFGVE